MEWIALHFYSGGEIDAGVLVDYAGAWAAETPRGSFFAVYYV